jgi:GT2 family glycosyltransferase
LKQVAVIILNYNGSGFLKQFLPGVIKNSLEADIYVIDNASTDDSINILKSLFKEVKIILLDKNYGFTGGYNKGTANILNPYWILLNSDIEVSPNWIRPILNTLQSEESIAVVQPKILDFNKKNYFEYAGAAGGEIDIFGYAFCRGRIFDHLEQDFGQYNQESDIFWASGACFGIKKEDFKSQNGFDDTFFAHMEEIDLCWRLKNKGKRIVYAHDSHVYHVGGGTLHKSNPFKTYLNYRNNLSMMLKNLPAVYVFPLIFLRLLLDGVSALKLLKDGKFKDILAILKAHFSFYAQIPRLIISRGTSFSGFSDLKKTSIVWQFFGKKKKTYNQICKK